MFFVSYIPLLDNAKAGVEQKVALKFPGNCTVLLADKNKFITEMKDAIAAEIGVSVNRIKSPAAKCGSVIFEFVLAPDQTRLRVVEMEE